MSYAHRARSFLSEYPLTLLGVCIGIAFAAFLLTRQAAIEHRVDKVEERVIILDRGVAADRRARSGASAAKVCKASDPRSAACADLRKVLRSLSPTERHALQDKGRVHTGPRPKSGEGDRVNGPSPAPSAPSPGLPAPQTTEPPGAPSEAPRDPAPAPAPERRPAPPTPAPPVVPPVRVPTVPAPPVPPLPGVTVQAPGVDVTVDPGAVVDGATGAVPDLP